jgi:long-chain acyl-CoA synthetase
MCNSESLHNVTSEPKTIRDAFSRSVDRYTDKYALMYKDETGVYRGISYGELDDRSNRLAASLRSIGIQKGDRVAIFAYHGPEWVISDLAIMKLGAIVVPLYHTLSSSALQYILDDAGCALIFAENAKLFASIEEIRDDLPVLEHVVLFEEAGTEGDGAFIRFDDLVAGDVQAGNGIPFECARVSPDDTATIVYTSGTTGEPKGVVLSHYNIVSNAFAAARRFHITSDDVFLSFLPLCHMFEKTCGYYTMLFSGVTIAYAGDLTTIVEDVQAIRPTLLIIVPRILEKIYEAVEKRVLEAPFIRRKLVTSAIRCLNRRANLEYRGQKVPATLKLICAFFNRNIASKFRNIAGGKLRLLVSGGAPLDRRLAKTLYVLGFNILEGYGLTEASPVVCTACLDDNRLGTVGKPLEGVEVRIGEGDEILVRGANIMKGYFNKPEETAEVIDGEGWFHTGDQGRFDDNGNLVITGRIKEIIVTSYGKNVAPIPIESEITKSMYVDQAMLYGDNRKYITALIVPQREAIERYARENGIDAAGYEELLNRDEIRALIGAEIERATVDCARFEKVKAFALIPENFSVANKLLTPTLKLRRKKVIETYMKEIEAMYVETETG